MRLPLYFNCHFFKSIDSETIYKFKIDSSNIPTRPYELFRRKIEGWQDLSVNATISDAVMILLKELFSVELIDEISHGQATVNPKEILEKINQGERIIAIHGYKTKAVKMAFDVNFEDLVERV